MPETAQKQQLVNGPPKPAARGTLIALLGEDLGFHDQASGYASHNFHSFPAKFPPQLPQKFITALTEPGEVVLDPMMGSGTTVVEAFLAGRQAVGIDIDPLAMLISRVKVTPANISYLESVGDAIELGARIAVEKRGQQLAEALRVRWDSKTAQFVDAWFAADTQLELLALVEQIENLSDPTIRPFFVLALSAIIITKSGGVSLALDLGHTRPHRAKLVMNRAGEVIIGDPVGNGPARSETASKTIGSPIVEFRKRLRKNINGVVTTGQGRLPPLLAFGNAQSLPIASDSVDLMVTSPPYASNAIDYMRAHKFSLVWLGHALDTLGQRRRDYIGGETVSEHCLEALPPQTEEIVALIGELDERKGKVLHRYYSEMTRTLKETFRVLKPGKTAVVVVGTSVMRGRNTETAACLAEIGKAVGFDVPRIGVRPLDRDRRMLPIGNTRNMVSQIQNRMHEEYVIGFLKPQSQGRLF